MGHLFVGLRSIKMKDSSKHRGILFQNYINTSLLYQLVLKNPLMKTHSYQKFISYLFSSYSFLNTLRISIDSNINRPIITVYEHNNEIRCIKARMTPEQFSQSGFITFSKKINFWVLKQFFKNIRMSFRLFKLCARLIQKNGVLIGTRQGQFLFFYALTDKIKILLPTSFIISTESNPNVIGVALGYQKKGHKIIYINHGFLDSDLGLFFHDQIVAQGDALIERIKPYIYSNTILSNVGAYYPVQELKLPISEIKVIGIVLSLNPLESKIIQLIADIEKFNPEVRIEIRPHPNLLFSSELIQNLKINIKVKVLSPTAWTSFHNDWDLAIAGNTSAHIDLIAKGIPCIGMNIDKNPDDLYGFYSSKYILKSSYNSEIKHEINDFYSNGNWKIINKNYLPDASPFFDIT
jgi:hypothetical protein